VARTTSRAVSPTRPTTPPPAGSAQPGRVRLGLVSVCISVATVAALDGCTPASPQPEPNPRATNYVAADRARMEYRHAEQSLVLGGQWTWPKNPESATAPDGAPQFYEIGTGTNDAQVYWFCSWITDYIRVSDPGRRREAESQVNSVVDLALYKTGLAPEAKTVFDATITALDHGDVADVATFEQDNCATLAP
jgi:hypothetical protein